MCYSPWGHRVRHNLATKQHEIKSKPLSLTVKAMDKTIGSSFFVSFLNTLSQVDFRKELGIWGRFSLPSVRAFFKVEEMCRSTILVSSFGSVSDLFDLLPS